ncbi:hypothetical protein SAMN05216184_10754 [Georgenia satyanarayanai]|uniref:Uncharacterized protein n=1 Tax=Georgenia satyanarayanai TaxID=860221 RepID=A0A2Y9AGS1_9MICO|nr:hypothetical protein [Georgenia satyanarayanai]PYF99344.1 hypothetical protein A8987_10754 [Georgenia satyanarayanai]SSA43156.1 hypothetical protein SAMN05216184_10754 [Georgenia satyanarayanai]
MSEDVCESCGAANPQGTQFCRACDAYLGWDTGATTIGGHPAVATVPDTVDTVETAEAVAPLPASHQGETATAVRAAPADARAPEVHAATTEVTLVPEQPGTVTARVSNRSSVVDGVLVEVEESPDWLDVSPAPLRLMPGDEGTLEVALRIRDGALVPAQRLTVQLHVCSESAPDRRVPVAVTLTVAPHGPPATLDVQPRLLRLTDEARARFVVRIDNRRANYPQGFELSGGDPEGVVRFGFVPRVVQVPAGQLVEVRGHFMAPAPAPGQDATRQLTVTAANDGGESVATLTLVQHTSPEPEVVPVGVRLSPRELRVTNAVAADFEVHVDNRGGREAVELALGGRDPARSLVITLAPQRLLAPPGQVTVARGHVQLTEAVPRGRTVVRPFTVVAGDGASEHEAPGSLEVTMTPSPITTAQLQVTPRHLTRADTRHGSFAVLVDNTAGQQPLSVRLTAVDSHGTARVGFTPPVVSAPPGGVGQARMTVQAPPPPGGESVTRDLEITADDGEGRLLAHAAFTQTASDRRPLLRTLLVLGGAALVLLGTLLPWNLLTTADGSTIVATAPVQALGDLRNVSETAAVHLVAAATRVLLVVLAVAMAFGVTGKGSLTRKTALLVVLLSVAYVIAAIVVRGATFRLDGGLLLLWTGAVAGYVGGVLARPA